METQAPNVERQERTSRFVARVTSGTRGVRVAAAIFGASGAAVSIAGCERASPPANQRTAEAAPAPRRSTFVSAAAPPVAASDAVREVISGAPRGTDVLVYVGASWCEPCQRFHEAVVQGRLDATLPNVTFVEFDLDRDRDRLAADGYASQYVPLFAVPTSDGRATDRRVEGAIKGDGAVALLEGKLKELLGRR